MFACLVVLVECYGRPNYRQREIRLEPGCHTRSASGSVSANPSLVDSASIDIDAIYQAGIMIAITVDTSKTIDIDAIEACMAGMTHVAVGAAGRFKLMVAVPDGEWRRFNHVSFIGADGARVPPPAYVDMMVLSIPMRALSGRKRGRFE